MHFSTFVVSMMATNAMAWRHSDNWQHQNQHYKVVTEYEVVTHVVTAGAEVPQQTYVPEEPAPAPVEVQPTTFKVVKKPKATGVSKPKEEPEKPKTEEPSTGSGSSSLSADQQKAVDLHNEARKAVGNDPLEWDDALASGAQEWADHLVSVGSLTHSGGADGENLYQGFGETPYADAVEAFLSEKSSYGGEAISESNYMGFGHYTQCVWKTTTKVGMAVSKGSDGAVYVVARYQKPGNMIGDTPY